MKNATPSARPTSWAAKFWTLHRWLGLGFGLVILAIGLSGAVLLFEDELNELLSPQHFAAPAPSTDAVPVPLNPALASLEQQFPDLAVAGIYWPAHGHHAVEVTLRGPDRSKSLLATLNPWTGQILSVQDRTRSLHFLAMQFHYRLLIDKPGMILTTLAGFALTVLPLTGLWLNRRIVATLLRAPLRLGRGARLAWSDLHKWLGVLGTVFALILGVTGLIYMWRILPGEFRPDAERQARMQPTRQRDWAQLPDLTQLRATAIAALPDHEFTRLSFPSARRPAISASFVNHSAWWWDKRATVQLDPRTGAVVKIEIGPQRAAGDRGLSALAALHFGTLGAPWVRWLYLFLAALAPAALAVSGVAIWLVRTRRQAPGAGT